ncbi:hypothetical protein FQA39_LY18674 [Lamprigera yunnana]|nr:hypothetical protein FQA39_LY18674 [Lamprigera yunnana]
MVSGGYEAVRMAVADLSQIAWQAYFNPVGGPPKRHRWPQKPVNGLSGEGVDMIVGEPTRSMLAINNLLPEKEFRVLDRDEGGQNAHGDGAMRHQIDAKTPDDEQAHFGQQGDGGGEQRPGFVHAVVGLQIGLVGFGKAVGFALFLGKGFDHADAGDGVGQHIGHLGPDAVDLLEAGAQPVAHGVDHPGDEGQRHQGDQCQPGVDGEQDDRGHHDHQHTGGKSSALSDRNRLMRSVSAPMRAIKSPVRLLP